MVSMVMNKENIVRVMIAVAAADDDVDAKTWRGHGGRGQNTGADLKDALLNKVMIMCWTRRIMMMMMH